LLKIARLLRVKAVKALLPSLAAVLCTVALAGPGSASAETLCSTTPFVNECPLANRLGIPTTIKAQTGEAVFLAGSLTIKCVSKIKGETVANLGAGAGLKGKLTELTLTTCTNCNPTSTAENLPYKFVMTATSGTVGTVDFLQWEALGNPQFKFTGCFGTLTCIYGAASIEFKFKASAGATKAAFIEVGTTAPVLQKQEGSNVACAGTAKIEKATYEISEPLPLWLAKEP
jgi:hypothetical protein